MRVGTDWHGLWPALRVRGVRGGSGQDFSNSCGCGAGSNFAGADKKFQPPQESNIYPNHETVVMHLVHR